MSPPDAIRITLPLPPKELHPNTRVHWRGKAKATKAYRLLAWATAKWAAGGKSPPRWRKAETRAVFYFATNRRRDEDGCSASLKPAWDGIADAGIVTNDSGLTHHPPELCLDPANPRVELELRPLP